MVGYEDYFRGLGGRSECEVRDEHGEDGAVGGEGGVGFEDGSGEVEVGDEELEDEVLG